MESVKLLLLLGAITNINAHISVYKNVFTDKDYEVLSSLQCSPREGWKKLEQSKDSVVYTNSTSNQDISFTSCLHFPGISSEKLFTMSINLQIRKKFDQSIKEAQIIQKYDKNNYLINWVFKSPVDSVHTEPIQLLQYMQIRRYEEPQKYYIVFKSAEDPRVAHEKGTIWAKTVFSGYGISADPNDPESSSYMVLEVHILPDDKIPEDILRSIEKLGPEKIREKLIGDSE